MQPVLFGTAERRLAGLYHAPAGGYSRRAFLLCNPFGQEAIRVYRCYREIALRLSGAGAHVFRFDYSGCGDSWGGAADCSVAAWLQDIRAASVELMDTSAAEHLSMVAFRLGGTLALMAGDTLTGLDRMILVDPVASGRDYLAAAGKAHRVMLEDPDRFPRPRMPDETSGEMLGFETPAPLLEEISAMDLFERKAFAPCRVDIISSNETPDHQRLCAHLRHLGLDCDHARVPCDTRWDDGTALERTLLAPAIVGAIMERAAL